MNPLAFLGRVAAKAAPAAEGVAKAVDPAKVWKGRALKGTLTGLGVGVTAGGALAQTGKALTAPPAPKPPQHEADIYDPNTMKMAGDELMELMGRLEKTATNNETLLGRLEKTAADKVEEGHKVSPTAKGHAIGGAVGTAGGAYGGFKGGQMLADYLNELREKRMPAFDMTDLPALDEPHVIPRMIPRNRLIAGATGLGALGAGAYAAQIGGGVGNDIEDMAAGKAQRQGGEHEYSPAYKGGAVGSLIGALGGGALGYTVGANKAMGHFHDIEEIGPTLERMYRRPLGFAGASLGGLVGNGAGQAGGTAYELHKHHQHGKEANEVNLMDRLEKTAEEQPSYGESVGRGAIDGAGWGAGIGGIGGGLIGALNPSEHSIGGHALGALSGVVGGAVGGIVPGALIGAISGGLTHDAHAQKEASELIGRLAKTANDMEIISLIAHATGMQPEEVLELSQNNPDQFNALIHQIIEASQGEEGPEAGQEGQGMPRGAEQGMPQGAEQGMPQGAEQGMPQGAEQGMPQGAEQGMPQGAEQGMPQGAEQGMPQGAEQAMPQGMPQGHVPGAGGLVNATGIGQEVGEELPSENPREGAASVSHNPAGVDKTAAPNTSLLMVRLQDTLDAAQDVNRALKAKNDQQPGEEKKAADLMESLEKTAAGLGGIIGKAGEIGKQVGDKAKELGGVAVGATKKYIGDVSGKNIKKAEGNLLSTMQNPNSTKFDRVNAMADAHLAPLARDKAVKGTLAAGIGVAGLAGLAGGYAAGKSANQEKRASEIEGRKEEEKETPEQEYNEEVKGEGEEKNAKEKFMTGIFKEAAAAIMDEAFPKSKIHTDPINRIRFTY